MSLKPFLKKRVLIVDQLENYSFAIKKMLLDTGMKLVTTANSAQSVISGLQNVDYDVILCNYDLGEGNKNGQELLEELREKKLLKFSALFFILTAEVAKDRVLGTIETEPDGYLVKPITPADLEKRLTALLTQKQALAGIDQAIDQGHFEEAVNLCNERLQSEPRYAQLLQKTRAWLCTQLQRWDEARQVYEQVIEQHQAPWARLGFARLLVQQEQLDLAVLQLDALLAQDPNCIEAYDELARIRSLQGDASAARQLLEKAAAQSPHNLLRQKALADARLQTQDTEGALEAYRKVIKLSPQSIYARPEHYFSFANALGKQDGGVKGKLSKEAMEVLAKSRKRFADQPQIDLQSSLVEAQVQHHLGNEAAAQALFTEVEHKASLRKEPLRAETAVIAAETLISLGRAEEVEAFLQHSADAAASAGQEVGAVFGYLNNSVSLQKRQQATELNRQAIKLHGSGDLDAALASMRLALPLTPYHVSLNLNFLQILLQKIRLQPGSVALIQEAQSCLERVRHVSDTHREARRLNHLRKQIDALSSASG
ncbi:MAG: response regulator [Hahellaceae bacterium]|nr:response regulator [Hahellaceae bacterium]